MLFAEGSISASSSWRSDSVSPARTATVDWSIATRSCYSATCAGVIRTRKPSSPGSSGNCFRVR